MLDVAGVMYGQAADIAAELGPDVTVDLVRDWARRGLLTGIRVPGRGRGTTWYRLDQAAAAERATRTSTRGRPRQLDEPWLAA
jgi:hypothetical protein